MATGARTAISIDGQSETNVDYYNGNLQDDQLLWTSPVLSPGSHTLKLRVTGTNDGSASNSYVALDRVDIRS